jgi:hypothetical protein
MLASGLGTASERAATARWVSGAMAASPSPAASPITDVRLQQAYDYWREKSAGRCLPRRADLDPTEIPKLLADVMLVDVLPSGRYRYRLIGTENTREHGVNASGRYLDEVLPGPDYKNHVIGLYDECVRCRSPLYSECLFMSPEQRDPERHTKVLFLPLAEDGKTVNMVFVVQVFIDIHRAIRDRHFLEVRRYKEIAHALL